MESNDTWSPSDGEDSEMEPYIEIWDMLPQNHEIDINLPPPTLAKHQEERLEQSHHKAHKHENMLISDNKLKAYLFLIDKARSEGKLKYGSTTLASNQFNAAKKTVIRIWNTAKIWTKSCLEQV